MSQKSGKLIPFLLCLNIILICVILFSLLNLPQAHAQTASSKSDYILIPARLSSDEGIVWIVDPVAMQMTLGYFDRRNQQILFGDIVDLSEPITYDMLGNP